ncbi:ATP adenylyltransferase-domain-containing protein [Mycotypha africana]|uniref:ATP adenylyltransferase-domain-containing protein n=1 Tax=Mycotypha africana TaxID=64632 RepID=UPI0022FFE58B|nr:ATP adenylyltransferase-domain-containing protein [Mycotypha africana]KAI8987635.1 ATP adenylyltransferase-domain-containing protein [Mycotypha africana]
MSFLQEVEAKFNAAKESEDLISFNTTEVEKECDKIKFLITLVPGLSQKKNEEKEKNKDKENSNPFLNPNPKLFVKELDQHNLLLNKFSVVPNHLLITTKEFHKQSDPLLPNDIYEAFKIIQNFGSVPSLAFYNCGSESGASQGHKHLQVIPLKNEGAQPPIKALFDLIGDRQIGQIYALNRLPFVHVIIPLDHNTIQTKANTKETLTDYLAETFFGLLDAMIQQLRENDSPMTMSYNFLLTQDFMMLVPRLKEVATIEHEGKKYDFSLNSLAIAGLMLCKSDEELKALEAQDNLVDILTQVTVPLNPVAERLKAERSQAEEADLA